MPLTMRTRLTLTSSVEDYVVVMGGGQGCMRLSVEWSVSAVQEEHDGSIGDTKSTTAPIAMQDRLQLYLPLFSSTKVII